MSTQNRIVAPGFKIGTVLTEDGKVLVPPADWAFLPAGDAPLTRNVKKRGPSWQVQVKKGRRHISRGIWTHQDHIEAAKSELQAKRATPEYAKKRAADLKRRENKHKQYVEEFFQATISYLNFHPRYTNTEKVLARAVTDLATPIGSGTVARTERIPLSERVQAAVIAWLRHQTTAYDTMSIARVKGRRRETRRLLAEQSKLLLGRYRSGQSLPSDCPLQQALQEA